MNHKVLFVDDDVHVLSAFERQLRRQFHIVTAQTVEAGLKTIREDGPYAVVVSDLRMPGMEGHEFLARAKKISPKTVQMMLTGHADLGAAVKAINDINVFRLLTKPCASEVVADAIRSGIEKYLQNTTGERKKPGVPQQEARRVLVVDDDPEIREQLADELQHDHDLKVLSAENGQAAVRCLNSKNVSLVVTGLKMPVMSGLKLLEYLIKHHPNTPAIVVTGNGNADIESTINKYDLFQYYEKPLDVGVLKQMIYKTLNARLTSQVSGVSVAAFLQMISSENRTCRLSVQSDGRTGNLYLHEGDLVDASTGSLRAERAAYAIVGWEKPTITIVNDGRKVKRSIRQSLMSILMEGARMKDEMGFAAG